MRLAPPPVSLRQLQYVVAVAETRSFRRAAARCGVSQPSLSAQLAQVEEALGVRLFERDRRGVLPTSAGEQLVERARRVLVAAEDLAEAARGLGDPLAGTLRVGVIPTVSPYLLPALVPALGRAAPRLATLWTEEKTEQLVAAVEGGSLDGALLALEAPLGELAREPIGADPFVLAAPADHPLARSRGPLPLGELRDAEVLLLDDGHCLRNQALAVCARARARERDFRATSLTTLVQMVSAGGGVTLLPALAIPTETRRAKLRLRRIAPPAPARTLGVVWRRGTARAPALRVLAETARRCAARLLGEA